ncbi:retrotransposon protein, putative, ty1-copia subclass, partial [Tanacetum coccineum]
QLCLVLLTEDKEKYLEHPIPVAPVAQPGQQVPPKALKAHAAWVKGQKEVVVLMLLTIDLEIQQNLAHLGAYDMLQELKAMFFKQAKQELLITICMAWGKTVNELHAMLKLHEETLPKKDANPALHAIRAGRVQKNQKNKPHKAGKGVEGLRGSKKLKPGVLSLYVGDGHCASVEAIGTYHLELPSGLVIVLNNCHYAPSITRGVISVSILSKAGFVNRFEDDNSIFVLKNNVIYFNAVPRDEICEIVMSSSNTNECSMYNVTNKRAKHNLDSALLWHCHLGHINKERLEKLQHDGLLNLTNIKFFEKCAACMSGKMARKPFSHQVERAKDILGLIHTDVCGLFRIMSRQGANYFVTFIDEFSRYGYVYLLKHKHEVFENFKEHRIIAHRTPPYTPQHNGVSERRNRTLLDMVRSMISQTTLPKTFWDYALETVARILNMVPTKKAFVKRDTLTKPNKLDPRSFKCIFVGYPKETMGYSFYSPSENKVSVARNDKFFKSKLLDLKGSRNMEDLELIQEEDTNPSVDTSLNHEKGDQEIYEPQSDINPI